MKLAYLFSRYPVPSQTFCDTEICALEDAGFEVEIYSCSPPTTSFRHGIADWPRARVYYAPPLDGLAWWEASARADGHWPGDTVARHEAVYGPRYEPAKRARHAVYFAALLRRRGIEHLHVHFANRATHAALFIHELTGIPFSFTAHAQDFLVDLGSDALLAEMCARAAFIVAVSEWSRQALLDKCPDAAAKIHRIYNGLPLERWPEPAPAADMEQPLQIFSVGRLIEFKGFAELIAACDLLTKRGISYQCEIAGDGSLRESLQDRIAALGSGAPIRLVGLLSQEEVRARLSACDVFALPCCVDAKGASDVLPTVILEAMAAGRAVVSTRLSAVPEMVDNDRTGLLVEPGDPIALADALTRLAQQPELRRTFGRAGREKWVNSFTARESAEQLAKLFTARETSRLDAPRDASMPTVHQVACLVDRWPLNAESTPAEPLDFDVHRCGSGSRLIALKCGGPPSGQFDQSPETKLLLSQVQTVEFLPDAFVLEAGWNAHPEWVQRIESWRSELGNACETEDFLAAAWRAFYLKSNLAQETRWGHLHAIGPRSTLCAWLLKRLDAVESVSFLLGSYAGVASSDAGTPGLAGSTLRKLAPAFAGGWIVGERKLAASLGPGFHSDKPAAGAWGRACEIWGTENDGMRSLV